MWQAVIPGNLKRRHKLSPYDSSVLFYWVTDLSYILSNRPSFLSIWLIFPHRNYQSRSIEYNFNWYWRPTLHLKKKAFPIFENLLKTSGTTTKVPSWLCVLIALQVVGTSSPGSSLVNSTPQPPPRLTYWSLNPL